MGTVLTTANNKSLLIPEVTMEHLLTHLGMTMEILQLGASRLYPSYIRETKHINLADVYGNWGVDLNGVSASFLAMVTEPSLTEDEYNLITAFCSQGVDLPVEPITRIIDPETFKSQVYRETSLFCETALL